MKQTNCEVRGCRNEARYCRLHITGSIKTPKPVAHRSKKLSEVMKKEYVPQVKEMVEKGTACSVNSPVCTKKAQGFHHPAGRIGKELLSKKKIPCCNPCNVFMEQNDLWARNHGFKVSRHANYKREK